MSDNNGEAAEIAERAAEQAKHATKNAGKAAKAAAEPVLERVVDEAHDIADKLEGTRDDAFNAARRVDPRVLSRISGDTGVGFLALSVSIYSAALAYAKFRGVYANRSQVIS